MLRYHMAVVTPDNRLKREIKRITSATNSTAEFVNDASALEDPGRANLVIYDARRDDPPRALYNSLSRDATISCVLASDSNSLTNQLDLMEDSRVCSLLCHDDNFDDDEFIASATKALRGEVFGLQKYFPWGVTTFTMVLQNHDQKSRAIDHIMAYAQQAGVRGLVRDRIQLVADELMINALYHAPVDEHGNELYANVDRKELAQRTDLQPIEVQYGCSGRYFGMSVRDGGGSLTRAKALDYLKKVQKSGAADIENKTTGAGLGLQTVLRSVSKLVFNLDPGNSTEVVALFDLERFARGKVGARSMHVFVAPPSEPEADDEPDDEPDDGSEELESAAQAATVATKSGSSTGKWLLISVMVAVIAGLGGALYMKNREASTGAAPKALQLRLDSASSNQSILLRSRSGEEIRLTPTKKQVDLPPGDYTLYVDGE